MKKCRLSAEDLELLKQYGLEQSKLAGICALDVSAGETLLRQGEMLDDLYIVQGGTAKVCINSRSGKNLIICYYVSDGIFGDVELMSDVRAASTTVIAVSALRVAAVPIGSNEEYLKGDLAFMNVIAAGLAGKLARSSAAYAASALSTGEERLCAYILRTEHNGIFADVLSDVAQYVGMSYRHVFRVINSLCAVGILEKTDRGYRILDRDALRTRSAQ